MRFTTDRDTTPEQELHAGLKLMATSTGLIAFLAFTLNFWLMMAFSVVNAFEEPRLPRGVDQTVLNVVAVCLALLSLYCAVLTRRASRNLPGSRDNAQR